MAPATGLTHDGIGLIVCGVVCAVVSSFAVCLRFISRRRTKQIGADDWCCLFALCSFIGLSVTVILLGPIGYAGYPQIMLDPGQQEALLKDVFASQIFFLFASVAAKLSFVLFYYRIFDNRGFRIAGFFATVFIVLWLFACLWLTVFQCSPVTLFWKTNGETDYGKCHRISYHFGTGIPTIVIDLLIIVMPLPMLWKSKMVLVQKLTLSAMLSLGLTITACSVLHTVWMFDIDFSNVSGTIFKSAIISCVELALLIICSSLPALPSLFHRLILGSKSRSSVMYRSSTLFDVRHNRIDSTDSTAPLQSEKHSQNHWSYMFSPTPLSAKGPAFAKAQIAPPRVRHISSLQKDRSSKRMSKIERSESRASLRGSIRSFVEAKPNADGFMQLHSTHLESGLQPELAVASVVETEPDAEHDAELAEEVDPEIEALWPLNGRLTICSDSSQSTIARIESRFVPVSTTLTSNLRYEAKKSSLDESRGWQNPLARSNSSRNDLYHGPTLSRGDNCKIVETDKEERTEVAGISTNSSRSNSSPQRSTGGLGSQRSESRGQKQSDTQYTYTGKRSSSPGIIEVKTEFSVEREV